MFCSRLRRITDRMPALNSSMRTASALTHLTGPDNLVLRRSQFGERKRSAAVQFLRTDSHLRAKAKLSAIGESCGGVPVHRSRIHSAHKFPGVRLIVGHNRIAVLGRVTVNVSDCV